MYCDLKSFVKMDGHFSEYFSLKTGLMQGAAKLGMNYILWVLGISENNKNVCDVKHFSFLVEQRLTDAFKQSCFSVLEKSSKCIVYKEIIDKFCLQKYLKKRLSHVENYVLCKYRFCVFP